MKEPTPPVKPLTKLEKEVCELVWGGVPVDVEWVRNSELFKAKMKEIQKP